VQHPYLNALAYGELPDTRWALRDFGRQYYAYSAHFPRYLTAVISKLENPAHRLALMENLTEESGQYEQEELDELAAIGIAPEWIVGLPHPELFRRFRGALGVMDDDACPEAIEVVCWREQFLAILANGSAAEALGGPGAGHRNDRADDLSAVCGRDRSHRHVSARQCLLPAAHGGG
jgi:hypothetical protein